MSSAIRFPSQEKREEKENKNKEMKRGTSEISAMNSLILKNKRSDEFGKKKTTGKEQKGSRKTLKEKRREMKRGEKRREMG